MSKKNKDMPNSNTTNFDSAGRFVLDHYTSRQPFTSFLPGIAGQVGIPMWAFYVNRGQAITSFGVESKDSAMMEFQPANKAYQTTQLTGFRTFLKIKRQGITLTYEPFSGADGALPPDMFIGMNELEIQERYPPLGIQINVLYFILPCEDIASLVRQVTIRNISGQSLEIEMLDGMPTVIPYGVNNFMLKEFGRTVEAWMEVYNLEKNLPYFHVRASIGDTEQVHKIERGHFALSFEHREGLPLNFPVVVDPTLVFGQDTAFVQPQKFFKMPLDDLLASPQVTCGRGPCCFFGSHLHLEHDEARSLYTLYGHASNLESINAKMPSLMDGAYIYNKRQQSERLTQELTEAIATHTALPMLDAYCRQTFLDNGLRGGWPVLLGDLSHPAVYHLYSRKHGDPERDYNAFFLTAEFFSQGNGNYRDINQNRRSDVLFTPQVAEFNLRTFVSLIQADGYNPLVLKGSTFVIPSEKRAEVLSRVPFPELLSDIIACPFTPGELLKALDQKIEAEDQQVQDGDIQLSHLYELLNLMLGYASQQVDAETGDGYWIDHWVYNLDLIDTFQMIYPDRTMDILFEQVTYPYYDSPLIVQPRQRKYVRTDGMMRQYGAVVQDEEKETLITSRQDQPNWARTRQGRGDIFYTTLFAKLFGLAVIKFCTLDPWGMGIEMEAGRPGWYDAMNGLPALFGSSLPETYGLQELFAKLGAFLKDYQIKTGRPDRVSIALPVELYDLLQTVITHVKAFNGSHDAERDYTYWDDVSAARENYRQRIRLGFEGKTHQVNLAEVSTSIQLFEEKILFGIKRALGLNGGFPPTYFAWERTDLYDRHPKPRLLPAFLEGVVRAMRAVQREASPHHRKAKALYTSVKTSPLYDRKLKMYKVNAPLADQPLEIGRARAFPPGWLENESIWLHMEYKYLLEVLKAGLYDEFFKDIQHALIPFQDVGIYGRSPLENSSFIVSSAHPDRSLHGAGFVGRLSGATAEFLSLWFVMMAGRQPFFLKNKELCLSLKPILPTWLFDEQNTLSFKFLGNCMVTYHNPQRLNTYQPGFRFEKMLLKMQSGGTVELSGSVIPAPYAAQVREGMVESIEVFFA